MTEDEFLVKDYELKIGYLCDHFQRMWTRFNYFVTMEAALIGGKLIFKDGNLTWGVALVGTVLSLIWYVFGAQDRYLVQVYRRQVKDASLKVTVKPKDYVFVGDTSTTVPNGVSGWRAGAISTTKLAALFPLLVFAAWLTSLVILLARRHG